MKVIVKIDMPDHMDKEFVKEHREDFFPMGDNRISIDNGILEVDPTDDSFYLFEFIRWDD